MPLSLKKLTTQEESDWVVVTLDASGEKPKNDPAPSLPSIPASRQALFSLTSIEPRTKFGKGALEDAASGFDFCGVYPKRRKPGN